MHFELVLGWILVFVVLESQDPDDWQLPLSQLLIDPDREIHLCERRVESREPRAESCGWRAEN